MTMLNVLDLFSGIGGFSLGLERTGGFQTVAFCEIEEFPRRVLKKHWPNTLMFEDIRNLSGNRDGKLYYGRGRQYDEFNVGPIDVICGGYPCQPFSTASAGKRVAEDLWPEMFRVISEVRPPWVIAENVNKDAQGLALYELERIGYAGIRKRIGAHDAGAPHPRDRWWVCAYTDHQSKLHSTFNAEVAKLPEVCSRVWGWPYFAAAVRVPDGLPHRVDRIKALGNAVVPQVVERIGEAILTIEHERLSA